MKSDAQPAPVAPEILKPLLHNKIERMSADQLGWLNRVMLQIEAEELAGRIGVAFDQDAAQGRLQRIPELVSQFRSEHRY